MLVRFTDMEGVEVIKDLNPIVAQSLIDRGQAVKVLSVKTEEPKKEEEIKVKIQKRKK